MQSSRPTLADYRHLARLAIPVTLIQLGLMLMGVVDTMVVGRLSASAMAGTAVGSVYVFALASFGMGLLMGLEPLLAQAVGARDDASIARGLQRGVVLAVAVGALTALLFVPVGPVLRALGQSPTLVAAVEPYVRVQIPSMWAFYLFVLVRVTLQTLGILRPILITIALANLLNLGLDWALVFGKLGLPPLGVYGAGLATTIARWFMAIALCVLAWPALRQYLVWHRDSITIGPMLRVLWLGLPIGAQYLLEFGVFATISLLMGHLGELQVAAHQIAINLASLTFMVPLGVSSAGAILVGHAIGATEPLAARRAGIATIVTGVAFMSLSACAFLLLPGALARAYTPDAAVVAFAATLIPIAGVFQVFDGLQVVSIGVLRGAGDTRTPLVFNLVGYWLLALPFSLWLAFPQGLGAIGLWWGLVAGLALVGVALAVRVRVRLWAPLERLRVDDPGGQYR